MSPRSGWRQAGDKERLACLLQEAVFSELYEEDEYALLTIGCGWMRILKRFQRLGLSVAG